MATIITILNALIAIPKIAGYIELLVQTIVGWWVSRQKTETLSAISDAAAMTARAANDQDRYAAAQAWQDVFKRARVSSN